MKFPFILLVLTSGRSVTCDNDTFSDTCDYSDYRGGYPHYLCGDVCLNYYDDCDCGGQVIENAEKREYCCAPASSCTKTDRTDSDGRPIYRCPQGEVLSMDSPTPCNATGRCYNDILTSKHIGEYAQYTYKDTCIPWRDIDLRHMCQGVNYLCDGDEEVCGPQLICPESSNRYNMSTHTSRYYCYDIDDYETIKNNGTYDLVDRSDEDITMNTPIRILPTRL